MAACPVWQRRGRQVDGLLSDLCLVACTKVNKAGSELIGNIALGLVRLWRPNRPISNSDRSHNPTHPPPPSICHKQLSPAGSISRSGRSAHASTTRANTTNHPTQLQLQLGVADGNHLYLPAASPDQASRRRPLHIFRTHSKSPKATGVSHLQAASPDRAAVHRPPPRRDTAVHRREPLAGCCPSKSHSAGTGFAEGIVRWLLAEYSIKRCPQQDDVCKYAFCSSAARERTHARVWCQD